LFGLSCAMDNEAFIIFWNLNLQAEYFQLLSWSMGQCLALYLEVLQGVAPRPKYRYQGPIWLYQIWILSVFSFRAWRPNAVYQQKGMTMTRRFEYGHRSGSIQTLPQKHHKPIPIQSIFVLREP
jgi:hypothetical protein